MKANKKANARNTAKAEYLLSGLIECGQCGGTFIGKTNRNGRGYVTRYYACGNKYRNHTCKAKNINAEEIETNVVAQLQDYIKNSDYNSIADEALKAYDSANKNNHAEARKELAKLKTELSNGVKAILGGFNLPELEE
jgi:site-specific DNA recombinase